MNLHHGIAESIMIYIMKFLIKILFYIVMGLSLNHSLAKNVPQKFNVIDPSKTKKSKIQSQKFMSRKELQKQKITYAILTVKGKETCFMDIVGHPHLVPPFTRVASKHSVSSKKLKFKLPKCSQKHKNLIQNRVAQAHYNDGNLKLAAVPAGVMIGVCAISAGISAAVTVVLKSKANKYRDSNINPIIGGTIGLIGVGEGLLTDQALNYPQETGSQATKKALERGIPPKDAFRLVGHKAALKADVVMKRLGGIVGLACSFGSAFLIDYIFDIDFDTDGTEVLF